MTFFQLPPELENQFTADRVLRSYLARAVPPPTLAAIVTELTALGALAGSELYALSIADRLNEPQLTQWDAWGHRIDRIALSPLWKRAHTIAVEHGLVATGYEQAHGAFARVVQFAKVYLFAPSSDVYTCPLAMTDGAARTLLSHGDQVLIDRAVPRLTSRDPDWMWTSGQWMTERTGGSDVGLSETVARKDGDRWRLYGTKWFSSATTSDIALTLARPERNPPAGRGLALFYLETRDARGRCEGICVNRLKDKLGTRKVPTAELTLDGVPATPVAGLVEGVKHIAPMLNITRTWNAVCAAAGMRRAVALARDYATKRTAFGGSLAGKPLHLDTLAGLQAESEAAFHLAFFLVELLGAGDRGLLPPGHTALVRLLTPLVKLTTAKQAVAVASEALECFGGAGYVEDTGLPALLRDAQVLPIWEGTTNVLSLDTLRIAAKDDASLGLLIDTLRGLVDAARAPQLVQAGQAALSAVAHACASLEDMCTRPTDYFESRARGFAMTLGRALALSLMVRHAQWSLDHEADRRAAAAALRFADHGVDLMAPSSRPNDSMALGMDVPAPVHPDDAKPGTT